MQKINKATVGGKLFSKNQLLKSLKPFSKENLEGDKPKPSIPLAPGPVLS